MLTDKRSYGQGEFVLPLFKSKEKEKICPETGSFIIEWSDFNLSGSNSNTCALKLVNDATGQFRYNRLQDGWKALLIEDSVFTT